MNAFIPLIPNKDRLCDQTNQSSFAAAKRLMTAGASQRHKHK